MHLQIAFIVSVLGLFVTMPIFVRYFAYTNFPLWVKVSGFLVCCLVAILPIFASRHWANAFGKYFPIIEHTLYFLYIFAVILFAVTFMRDILWQILHWLKILPSPFNPTLFTKVNIATALLVLLCAGSIILLSDTSAH